MAKLFQLAPLPVETNGPWNCDFLEKYVSPVQKTSQTFRPYQNGETPSALRCPDAFGPTSQDAGSWLYRIKWEDPRNPEHLTTSTRHRFQHPAFPSVGTGTWDKQAKPQFWHSPMILSVASLHNQARLLQHLEMDLESECEKISWRPWYPS